MKKLFLLGILFLFVSSSFAQDVFEVDGIQYYITSSAGAYTVAVINKTPYYDGDIVIPEQVQYNSQMFAVTTIYSGAFENCKGLTSIILPNSLISIGSIAFNNCTGLTSIIIPNSVEIIVSDAFNNCSSLTSIAIPNSLTSLRVLTGFHSSIFDGCRSLISIEVSPDNANYTSIDGVLYNKNKTAILKYPRGRSGHFKIPNSVTSIGNEAFISCSSLTSIEIPNSVTSIGISAFSYSGLTSITIPNSVTDIANGLFFNCKNLTSVSIPNSVKSIRYEAFSECSSLTSLLIPNSVTSIGEGAFSWCKGLTSIEIPNSVTEIELGTFEACRNLTTALIPNSVKIIGNGAFAGCYSLTSVKIPNSVTEIRSYAFSGCSNLKSIEFLSSELYIATYAFSNCSGINSIFCHADIPPKLGTEIFIDIPRYKIPLYVPYKSVKLYDNWWGQWSDFDVKILQLPYIGSGENQVSGKLYMDANANGKNDNNERGLSQQLLLILPDSVYAQTDNAGNYTFRCDTGSYQIQLVLPDNWRATSVSKYDVEVRTADTSGFDFGMAAIREESRSEVSIASLDGGRCFEPAPVYLTYNNNGTSIENGWLKYYPDSQFGAILKSVPAYDSLSADSSIVFWKMSDVMPFEQRNIMLQMQMPDFTAMGDTLVSVLAFEDKASVQYTDTAKLIVRCSYDPNDKQVNPAGVQDEHFVLMSDPLEFTIRFQNTGNDVANRVVILDTLSQHLDLATFAVIASSHSVKTNRNNEGAVEFRFDNIMLADSTTNEPASHGFVKYRVKAKRGLPDSTVVENTSHIFFDYNPAVVTNTTAITMTYKIPIKEIPTTEDTTANVSHNPKSGKAVASIHPNPFSKTALLEFDNPNKDVFELQIANVTVKTQQTIKSTGNLIVIERGDMPEGLYFFTLRNTASGLVYNGSFVVE